jgi:hypothetical protein
MSADDTSYEILTSALGLLTATHADRRMAGPLTVDYLLRASWRRYGPSDSRVVQHTNIDVYEARELALLGAAAAS